MFSPTYKLSVKLVTTIRDALRHISENNAHSKETETRLENIVITKPIDMAYGGGFLVFDGTFNIKKMVHMGFISEKPLYTVTDIEPNMDLSKISDGNSYDMDEIVKDILKIINNEEPTNIKE
jgi:hypothetical protein